MKGVFSTLKKFVKYIHLDWRLRTASRLADALAKGDGMPRFVMPDTDGNLVVLSLKEFRQRSHKATRDDLYRECFYCTRWKALARLPMVGIKAKRKMYFEFYGL